MATIYGDAPAEYPYMPQKKKKQKYTMTTRVIDFTNNLPITSGAWNRLGNATTAWAVSDILQFIHIRAGQTVLAVQVELLTYSKDTADAIEVGYGSDVDRWGRFNLYGNPNLTAVGMKQVTYGETASRNSTNVPTTVPEIPCQPLYFASADTIDIKILRAAVQGKIRVIVHLLEDDR